LLKKLIKLLLRLMIALNMIQLLISGFIREIQCRESQQDCPVLSQGNRTVKAGVWIP